MGFPVVTTASGGKPVMDTTNAVLPIKPSGMPVTEATNGIGMAVTKVTSGGMPVIYVVPPL